jgi:hypothetical protein
MPCEDIVFIEQSAWKTWATPDKGFRVDSWTLDPGIEYVDRRLSGNCRGQKYRWLGPKRPTGSFEFPAHWEYIGWFVKNALMHDVASTQQGATAAYLHGFFPKDDTLPFGLSVQMKVDSDDSKNVLGVVIDTLTFSCTAGESLNISGDYIAYDEAPTGGTWDFDGATGAPAVIASPSYVADTILPFRFQNATLTFNGTLTFDDTENKYTLAGGNTYNIEACELSIANNLDPKVFLGNRVAGNFTGQDREITATIDFDQSTVDDTFYDLYRAGTEGTLFLEFDSGVEADTGFNYTMTIVVPRVSFGAALPPDVSGTNDRRMQAVEMTGLVDSDGQDFNVQIIDTQTSY